MPGWLLTCVCVYTHWECRSIQMHFLKKKERKRLIENELLDFVSGLVKYRIGQTESVQTVWESNLVLNQAPVLGDCFSAALSRSALHRISPATTMAFCCHFPRSDSSILPSLRWTDFRVFCLFSVLFQQAGDRIRVPKWQEDEVHSCPGPYFEKWPRVNSDGRERNGDLGKINFISFIPL